MQQHRSWISRLTKEAEEQDTESAMVFYGKKYMLRCFRFFYLHREFIDALITAGMGDLFLSKITEYLELKRHTVKEFVLGSEVACLVFLVTIWIG